MSANAFALLQLGDNEDPLEALDRNVSAMQKAKKASVAAKSKAKDTKPPVTNKSADAKKASGGKSSGGDRRADRGESRGPDRREQRERRAPRGADGRPPRRESDRKSGTGRRPQESKDREESRLNLGKATQAEEEAKEDALESKKSENDQEISEEVEPVEPEKVTQTLAEYKASLTSNTRSVVQRSAGEGEDASKWKSTKFERGADEKYEPKGKKRNKKQAKVDGSSTKVDVNFKFADDFPRREARDGRGRKGGNGSSSSRAPDVMSATAFPALS